MCAHGEASNGFPFLRPTVTSSNGQTEKNFTEVYFQSILHDAREIENKLLVVAVTAKNVKFTPVFKTKYYSQDKKLGKILEIREIYHVHI